MKKYCVLILFIFCNYVGIAQVPDTLVDESLFSLELLDFEIDCPSNFGDTIMCSSTFTTHVSGNAMVGLQFPEGVVPPDALPGEVARMDTIYIDSGQVYIRNYQLVAVAEGISEVNFFGTLIDEPPMDIDKTMTCDNKFQSYQWGCNTLTADEIDDCVVTYNEAIQPIGGTGGPTNFHIEGKVIYEDWGEYTTTPGYPRPKSAFNIVRLWFRRDSDDYTFIHPVELNNDEYIEGVHYAVCDEDGNFEFDFTINQNINTGDGWKLEIHVSKENEAINLFSKSEHAKVLLANGSTMRKIIGMKKYRSYGLDPLLTNIDIDFTDDPIILTWSEGLLFRHAEIARRFIHTRFGGTAPFDIPQLDANLLAEGHNNNYHDYQNYQYINIQKRYKRIIYHEYGHYIQHAMENFIGRLNGSTIAYEGWADFFSDNVDSWAHNMYDEVIYINETLEASPFFYDESGQRYGHWAKADNTYQIKYLMLASFLENLYDGYGVSVYKAQVFGDMENDDISGYDQEIYDFFEEYFRTHSNDNIPAEQYDHVALYNEIKNSIAGNDLELNHSIEKIYEFCFDQSAVVPKIMLPAQVKELDYTVINQYYVELSWDTQTYNEGFYVYPYYSNNEEGYKIYEDNNGTWDLVQTNTIFPRTAVVAPDNTYKVTSFREYDNNIFEACNAPEIYVSPRKKSINETENNSGLISVTIEPNPFSENSRIILNTGGEVSLTINVYDALFRKITTIADNELFAGGMYERNLYGKELANGAYYIVISGMADTGEHFQKTIPIIKDK